MSWGKLARWNAEKAFGFVEFDYPPGEDVFCHAAVLQRAGIEPRVGTHLEFEVEEKNGKPRVRWAKRLKTWKDPVETEDTADQMVKLTGSIAHLNEEKGFLFVSRDDQPGVRVYCKYSVLRRAGVPAEVGQRVVFEIGERGGRPCVVAIEVAPRLT
ncbi:cold shock domain-containing protein [Bradyrhizobium sp. Leo121]|uniref:cold-shock protein n=1 Tax=Bradyrhizobium sp. Leo121 TaxID=1571195 RepID=UPI001028F336|nr:cold shock domain-containing protein [Bradyrhizobium sp. Leo121]RZN21122.1 hypothetical protein CWO90_33520 [Bradyrhizobium sp. Leo121]